MATVAIRIGTEEFEATADRPFVFGRADAENVVGLDRLARAGLDFDGPHANDELAHHLIDAGLIGVDDLALLPRRADR